MQDYIKGDIDLEEAHARFEAPEEAVTTMKK